MNYQFSIINYPFLKTKKGHIPSPLASTRNHIGLPYFPFLLAE